MIEIKITDESLEIKGHSEKSICNVISALTQYICSNLEMKYYECEYGYLKADFESSDISKLLIRNFVKFIIDMNYTGIYLIDKRRSNEKSSINNRT